MYFTGEDALDTDVPTALEARLFTTPVRKFIWLTLQPFFYAFRPLLIYPKAPTDLEVLNAIVQVIHYCTYLSMIPGKLPFDISERT